MGVSRTNGYWSYYCHVYGGQSNLNFHAWIGDMSIKKYKQEGCTVNILDSYFFTGNKLEEERYAATDYLYA